MKQSIFGIGFMILLTAILTVFLAIKFYFVLLIIIAILLIKGIIQSLKKK